MDLRLFALNASRDLGNAIARSLAIALSRHEEREFEDGEHKARPLESVRGCDVYVVQSLYADEKQSVNDKLVRLLFFLGALKDAAAERVTAVVPYLCYARKDRRSKPRDPLSSRYVASMLEAVGVDAVVTIDVHNIAAYQNAFRVRAEHLEAKKLFVEYFAPLIGEEPFAVVSPDVGGVKRADAFRESLERRLGRTAGRAFMEKTRSEGVVSGEMLIGDVTGRHVVVIDDLISSGATLNRAVAKCRASGANKIYAAATHGLFMGKAAELLANPELETLVVTDSVRPFRLDPELANRKLTVVSCVPLLAEAIRRMHTGGSLVELLGD
ncbi:MAG TPA: ribose-phosphate pyrophosphokinase [Burkholderiales bacterium]|nr:ribose-phosphate pyrophosphokinase [Burkholderiales bacterium]